jgi:hypothetical protein
MATVSIPNRCWSTYPLVRPTCTIMSSRHTPSFSASQLAAAFASADPVAFLAIDANFRPRRQGPPPGTNRRARARRLEMATHLFSPHPHLHSSRHLWGAPYTLAFLPAVTMMFCWLVWHRAGRKRAPSSSNGRLRNRHGPLVRSKSLLPQTLCS